MTIPTCEHEGCENDVNVPYCCVICDKNICWEHMTTQIMNICVNCDEVNYIAPSIGKNFKESYDDLREWFYDGFLTEFYDACKSGESFELHCPFRELIDGFEFIIPKRNIPKKDIAMLRQRGQILNYYFYIHSFRSVEDIETAFELLINRVKEEDPWWENISVEFAYWTKDRPPVFSWESGWMFLKLQF